MVYKNYISLGYFCNIASDLEELGFRNTSSPFDWEISVFEGVISAIDNRFNNFKMLHDIEVNRLKDCKNLSSIAI